MLSQAKLTGGFPDYGDGSLHAVSCEGVIPLIRNPISAPAIKMSSPTSSNSLVARLIWRCVGTGGKRLDF